MSPTAGGSVPHTPQRLSDLDAAHVWHPYSGFPSDPRPLVVSSAAGTRLRLADGREVVDGMSSWWAAIHGYRHPVLDAALLAQARRMSHVMFGGLTHEPAVRLAEMLVEVVPDGLSRVFFSDSGSVSVEVAVKMCLQFWRARGRPAKRRLLTWRGGYHGDTFTPMSVCDPEGGMHALWTDVLAEQVFVGPPPGDYRSDYVAELEGAFAAHAGELAAVVVEPVVQGAGGMRWHDPRYLAELRQLCDAHDVLLIFDEIATGFGRTGRLFAAEHAGVAPDVMCVGKALTGGYLTLAATLCTDRIARTISDGHGGLMHGPTFMANPLACAVAVASLELLLSRDWAGEVARIEGELLAGLEPLRGAAAVRDVRVLGAIGVVELAKPVDMASVTETLVAAGVWLRPFRNLLYTMPPFISSSADIAAITTAMRASVDECLSVRVG